MTYDEENLEKEYAYWKCIFWTEEKTNTSSLARGMGIQPKELCATVKHRGGSIMLWERFSTSGTVNLIKVEGTVKNKGCVKILKESLKQSASKLCLGHHFAVF